MKRNLSPWLLMLIPMACSILDTDPVDSIPGEDAIRDKRSMLAALNGVYNEMQTAALATDATLFADLAADNLIHIGTKKEYRQVSDQRIVPENAYVQGIWDNSYDAINRVNHLLDKLPDVSGISASELDRAAGQLYFLRALNYFNLVRWFGEVPLKDKPTTGITPSELNMARATVGEVYDFILGDLELAKAALNGTGRQSSLLADEGAVRALLARVQLYRQNWQAALVEAEAVLAMDYELVAGDLYASLFDESVSNNEIIFQIDYLNDDDVSQLADWCSPEARFEVAAWESAAKLNSISNAFAAEDKRKEVTVGFTGDDYYCNKYQDFNKAKDNVIVIRLAELYLIAAEALNELGYDEFGQAFFYLNQLRQRAGTELLTPADLPDQQAFRLAIEEERRLELAFEGHRYHDLVRTGRASEVLPKEGPLTQENQFLFPIPQSELDANKMITANNPGY